MEARAMVLSGPQGSGKGAKARESHKTMTHWSQLT